MADEPHPEVQAVLGMIEDASVPPTYAMTVESARERLEELFAEMSVEEVSEVEDFSIPGPSGSIPVRAYVPEGEGPHPLFVYLHGGGWVLGNLDSADNVCAALTNRAGCLTLSVDYRLAPEHPFPAAVEDAYAAVEWAADRGDRIGADPDRLAVGGDSAGGNLSAAASLMARDRDGPDLAHQLLLYPAVASPVVHEFDSHEENASGYFLERESIEWFYERYVQSPAHARNAYAAPLLANDLSGLPSATVLTAGFDPLRDEGRAYADRLAEAGVPVERLHYEDMIHGFVSLTDFVSTAETALDDLGERLAAAFE